MSCWVNGLGLRYKKEIPPESGGFPETEAEIIIKLEGI